MYAKIKRNKKLTQDGLPVSSKESKCFTSKTCPKLMNRYFTYLELKQAVIIRAREARLCSGERAQQYLRYNQNRKCFIHVFFTLIWLLIWVIRCVSSMFLFHKRSNFSEMFVGSQSAKQLSRNRFKTSHF